MSFYGNISNAGRTNLTFDKIYPNREMMYNSAQIDGVFVGRYVLIEYDDNTFSRRRGYLFSDDAGAILSGNFEVNQFNIYQDSTCNHPFVLGYEGENKYYGVELGDTIEVIIPITNDNGQITEYVYVYFICIGEADNKAVFSCYTMGSSEQSDYALNFIIDRNWALTHDCEQEFAEAQTWDSTIWQKTVVNGEYVYKMIGSLNSKSPIFTIESDAPTLNPVAPHFGQNSTNQDYVLHLQPNWGLKIKEAKEEKDEDGNVIKKKYSDQKVKYNNQKYNAEYQNPDGSTGRVEYDENSEVVEEYDGAIYFNKPGFVSRVRHKDLELPTEVSILPTGHSGKYYANHDNDIIPGEDLKPQPDIQEITMHLPAIGNAISDLWDLMYGEYEINENGELVYETIDGEIVYETDANGEFILDDNDQKIPIVKYKDKRNLDIDWGSYQGTRMVSEGNSGFEFDTRKTQTLAGAINSVHDLMGMIVEVAPTDENNNLNFTLGDADTDHIYYGAFKNKDDKGFYIKESKNTYYPYIPQDEDEIKAFYEDYYYPELTQYESNKYHIRMNHSYYAETADSPTKNTNYYDLDKIKDQIKEVKLISWIPVEKPKEEDNDDTTKPPFPDYSEVVLNHYYKNETEDFIRDYSSKADPNKIYYTLNIEQATYPKTDGYYGSTKILYNPTQRIKNADGTYSGYLYFIKDNNSLTGVGNQVFEIIPQKVDDNGNLVFEQLKDEDGNLVYKQMVDENGEYIYDEEGNPVYDLTQPVWDEEKPVYVEVPAEWREDAIYYYVNNYTIKYATSTNAGLTQIIGDENGNPFNANNLPDNSDIIEFLPLKEEILDEEGNSTGEFKNINYYYNMINIYDGKKIVDYELSDNFYLQDNEPLDDNKVYYLINPIAENGLLEVEKPAEPDTDNPETGNGNQPDTENPSELEVVDTRYYVKNQYYYQPDGSNNYIFGTEDNLVKEAKYYELPPEDDISAEDLTFYEPGKYYYSKIDIEGNTIEILDYDKDMRTKENPNLLEGEEILFDIETNRVHYLRNELYVIEDTAGILAQGSVWNSGWPIPSTITLGKLYKGEDVIQEFNENKELVNKEITDPEEREAMLFQWKELKGFSRALNTINGLILKLNQLFKFDDTLTRDRETIQGCLNNLNDLINDFGELNPGEIAIIDEYGRLKSAQLFTNIDDNTDIQGWISVEVDDSVANTKITFRHEDAKLGDDIEVQANTTIAPKFGESFDTITSLNIDAKGHVYTGTKYTIQLPKGSLEKEESVDNANVLTDLEFEPETSALKYKYQNVGSLKLTGYEEIADLGLPGGQASISADDTLNQAIKKLDTFTRDEAQRLETKINTVFDDKDASDLDSVIDLINWTAEHGKKVEEILGSIDDNKKAIESNDADILKLQNDLSTTNTTLDNKINTVESNLSSSIGDNKDAIDALKLLVGEKSVSTQIGEAIAAENLDQYATDTELNALNERIGNLENNTYQSQIDALNATIAALTARIEALEKLNNPTPSEPTE